MALAKSLRGRCMTGVVRTYPGRLVARIEAFQASDQSSILCRGTGMPSRGTRDGLGEETLTLRSSSIGRMYGSEPYGWWFEPTLRSLMVIGFTASRVRRPWEQWRSGHPAQTRASRLKRADH